MYVSRDISQMTLTVKWEVDHLQAHIARLV
jgi:hypothetical protein